MPSSLSDPEYFFTKFIPDGYNRPNVYICATRGKEEVTVYSRNGDWITDQILGVFRKASLVNYYLSQNEYYRFNTCPACSEISVFKIIGVHVIGEIPENYSVLFITETEYLCVSCESEFL